MTTSYPVRIERLRGAGIVRVAAMHNLREIAAEIGAGSHIDVARIDDNFILRGPGTAADVVLAAKSLMSAAGITKLRTNAVTALELLFTLPSHSAIDARSYFEDATCWAARHFGVPILSSIVHLDEAVPHCHVLLLPLINGKMNGSDLHGGPAKLAAMQASFHKEVGVNYGFIRHAPKKRLSATEREVALECARQHLETKFAMTVGEIHVLLKPHAADPVALLRGLGIALDSVRSKSKSFVEIMTAPCELERRNPIGKVIHDPSGRAEDSIPMESFPYTCVGKGFDAPSIDTNFDNQTTVTAMSTSNEQSELCNAAACTPEVHRIDCCLDVASIGANSLTMNGAALMPSHTSNASGTSTTSGEMSTTLGENSTERDGPAQCDVHIVEENENQLLLRDRSNAKFGAKFPEERLGLSVQDPMTRRENEVHRASRKRWREYVPGRYPMDSQLVSVQGGIRGPPTSPRLVAAYR